MPQVFLFETWGYDPVLVHLLCRPADPSSERRARLDGYRVAWSGGADLPSLAGDPGAQTDGVLIDATDQEFDRLTYFAMALGHSGHKREVRVEFSVATAEVFAAPTGFCPSWDFDAWQQSWGEINALVAEEVMRFYGSLSAAEIGRNLPMIQARAASRIRAGQGARVPFPSGLGAGNLRIRSIRRSHSGFFALDDIELSYDRFDGTPSEDTHREVFIAADAAIVLPYDPVTDRVLLVEQVRMGPWHRGDSATWQLEPVAGRIEPGERPEDAARRETLEEAGLTLRDVIPVAQTYPSPGSSSEFFYTFIGLSDLPETGGTGFGMADESEDIRTHILAFDALMDMVDRLAVPNAPLAMAALWLARARAGLRAEA